MNFKRTVNVNWIAFPLSVHRRNLHPQSTMWLFIMGLIWITYTPGNRSHSSLPPISFHLSITFLFKHPATSAHSCVSLQPSIFINNRRRAEPLAACHPSFTAKTDFPLEEEETFLSHYAEPKCLVHTQKHSFSVECKYSLGKVVEPKQFDWMSTCINLCP